MLEAKKSALFEKIFAVYNRSLFRRRFNSLQISGLNFIKKTEENSPLLIYANHSSWWDGLVACEIARRARLDSFVMMEEKQLRKLRFFRWLGAFSVVREKPRQALKSIAYASAILREKPNRAVWIFPQGEIFPNDIRPLRFFNGLTKIIEKTGDCRAVPIAMRYEFLGEFKPDIFIKIGAPELIKIDENFRYKSLTESFEKQLTETLNDLKTQILFEKTDDYRNLI